MAECWSTFLRLHAQGIIACDFLVAVTATFRQLYVFVVIEHRSRRLIHCNITAHPNATWTLQQLREAIRLQDRYKYLLHDRDSISARQRAARQLLPLGVVRSVPNRLPIVCACILSASDRQGAIEMSVHAPLRRKESTGLHKAAVIGVMPLVLFAATSLGGDGIDLNITNDGTANIFVTVYDTNTVPATAVIEHARISGFTTVSVSATPDATGKANISWTAISGDAGARKCGHGARVGLENSATIQVHADSVCTAEVSGVIKQCDDNHRAVFTDCRPVKVRIAIESVINTPTPIAMSFTGAFRNTAAV